MNIEEMTMEDVEQRLAAIGAELETADEARLEELNSEADALNARKADLAKEIEQRKADIADVSGGRGKEITSFEEKKSMNEKEIRSSKAYIDAFAKYVKTGDATECRALLTENVEGMVPVPIFVEGIVADALRESKIMSRVRKTYSKGNVKVGFERFAPAAQEHEEGAAAMAEENLQLGIITLVPVTLKKWVSISDEALDTMSGEAYLRYIYEEITRKIVKAEENKVIDEILAANDTATDDEAGVPRLTIESKGLADFINARALLDSNAEDLVIIMSPADYAEYKALSLSANFYFDPFEGIEVLFSDRATNPIIGDLSGVLANYPNGDAVQMKYDDTTLMTSDLVRVLGRKPVAIRVVANNYFAFIATQSH